MVSTYRDIISLHSLLTQHIRADTAIRDLMAEPGETLPVLITKLASTGEVISLSSEIHKEIGKLALDLLRKEFVSTALELAERGYQPNIDEDIPTTPYVVVYEMSVSFGIAHMVPVWFERYTSPEAIFELEKRYPSPAFAVRFEQVIPTPYFYFEGE